MSLRLVLASASPGRLQTLRNAGVFPEVMVSTIDEDAILAEFHAHDPMVFPATQVQTLAAAKAADVVDRLSLSPHPALVIGADSMLEIDGKVVGKPHDAHTARARWLTQRGRSGVLYSGHAVALLNGEADSEVNAVQWAYGVSHTTVHFATPTEAEIAAYIATGEPLHVAGAFTIDGLGGAFIRGLEGDPHGVVGLSLPLLREILQELGVTWTDLWQPELLGANG